MKESKQKTLRKMSKKRLVAITITVLIGFVVGYNIMDIFLDLLLGGRMF